MSGLIRGLQFIDSQLRADGYITEKISDAIQEIETLRRNCNSWNNQCNELKKQLADAHEELVISIKERINLGGQLAKAKKEAQNYKNVLIGQGFENLDALAYETRDTTQIGAIAKQRTEQIIAQLAEARAENERLNSVDHYACALCPDVAQARQDAAREILNDRLIIAYIAPDGIVHKQLLKKYGLEG